MATNILMPALSPTMEQGKLSKWMKKEGDRIKSGDVIAEIETDKATMEVEAVDEGVLGKILVPDGTENVAVNTPIGVILVDGESADAAPAAAPAPQQSTSLNSSSDLAGRPPSRSSLSIERPSIATRESEVLRATARESLAMLLEGNARFCAVSQRGKRWSFFFLFFFRFSFFVFPSSTWSRSRGKKTRGGSGGNKP